MHLSTIDVVVVFAYIVLIFFIAWKAKRFMKNHLETHKHEGLKTIESHYLAGKSITLPEALLSILATEFSALAFLTIPTYVYYDNLSYLKFVIGAFISRSVIAFYFLPKIYGKGLTIFEALARGIHGYKFISRESAAGKRAFGFFYIITKIMGTSVKLLGGAMLIAEFFDMSLFLSIVLIASMTYFYIILGGLKAVVRTDMLQGVIIIVGGVGAHYMIGKLSSFSWGELFIYGWDQGKFSLFGSFTEGLAFIYGILAGIAYDAATHGVDQDLVQKLFGTKDVQTAKKALAYSAVGSFFTNMLFLSLGVILWAYYTKHGQAVPRPDKLFSSLIENYFPSPLRGLMVASVLAASMSSLDSAINALSAVYWNDVMNVKQSKMFRTFINIDNFIITLAIIIVSYFISLVPGAIKITLHLAYLCTAPFLAFFLCRMLLSKWIRINYSPSLIFMSVITCFLGMGINHFRLGFNPQLTILVGILTTIGFMWFYSKLTIFFQNPSEKQQ